MVADQGAGAVGRITPSGQIAEFSVGLNAGSEPGGSAAGADGNLWFTLDGQWPDAIGRIGTGAPPALQTPASVTGARQEGSPETCQAQWSDWAGYSPYTALYPFDGYAWLRDGNPIAGQTTPTYTPSAADAGHQLTCRVTVHLRAAIPGHRDRHRPGDHHSACSTPAPTLDTGALEAGHLAPDVHARRAPVGGRCEPATRSNRAHQSCTRPVVFSIRFTLNASATVTLAIERALPGQRTRGRCTALNRGERRHHPCARLALLPGRISMSGIAGANAFTFTGVIGGHALMPGSYRLLATPTTNAGTGNQQQTSFKITR